MKLVLEALRSAVAQPVSSAVTALIVAGVCAVILSTTGQTVQAERQVLARIDEAGTRSIVISDTNGAAGLTTEAVDRIARIAGVEWVIGLGPATDVRPAGNPGGDPAAMRPIYGDLPPQIHTNGAAMGPGRALVGPEAAQTLGLELPFGGGVTNQGDVAIVGSFTADDPLAFLNRSLLTAPATQLRSIHILVERPSLVGKVADAALMVLAPADPTAVAIETSEALAQVRAAVQGELGRFGRNLITAVLAAGLVLTGLNVYGAVSGRRRDFGRRRALGASRPAIITLVCLQTSLSAILGAGIGSTGAWLALYRITGLPPEPRFGLAIAVLAVLTAVAAALPPAVVAAFRDPVRVLRVP
ncbi:MAG: hypothetical protein KatS3mg011_0717 [Acidimicrobiia bacterium]|nr:MAG: hypothetical protein KatS3mg011_0717 [Acidimicrobiia bacterium]